MLSETDIHYITGFLYITSGREDINVILGEKVYDEASQSERDVDIVIVSAGQMGMIGVEVKDKGRPLDVGIVEGICQKFNDMPSIKSRSIVSSSSYTEPARRKASKHNVECLKIVRGAVPPFKNINMSLLKEVTIVNKSWAEGPHVQLMPNLYIPASTKSLITPFTKVSYPPEISPSDITNMKELGDKIGAIVLGQWEGPSNLGDVPVTIDVEITDTPRLHVGEQILEVNEARVTGIIRSIPSQVPIEDPCYLEDESGTPFSAAAIIEFNKGLLGLSVSAFSQQVRVFNIPEAVRKVRPIRKRL